jgi:hypothetical protein
VTRLAIVLALVAAALPAGAAAVAPDPYQAALAYARCMRAHGVPHPNPDRKGDFSLTPAQDARLRAVGRAKVQAADAACFHYLKPVVSTKPLSPKAMAQAKHVLTEVRDCMHDAGFELGRPVVRNLTRGRAFFGFAPGDPPSKAMNRADHVCEQKVRLAQRIDAIVAADRAPV